MVTGARLTALGPRLADLHETTGTPTCLVAPDGDTCCTAAATTRLELAPRARGTTYPTTTFACDQHIDVVARAYPSVHSRRLTP